jgi:sodium-dependent dicarboxylate transporter 2/3/5
MMLPIGIAILALLEGGEGDRFGPALMLGIAYAASIGGVATLIGTPPNAIFAGAAYELLGRSIGFVEWMYLGVPLAAVMLTITWFLLVRVLFWLPAVGADRGVGEIIRAQRAELGRIGRGEATVSVVFALVALGWVLREPKELGSVTVPGLTTYLPGISDTTIAMLGAVALFALPVSTRPLRFALNWEWAVKVPWGVLLLFGGGLSLAHGFEETGLAAWIGDGVTGLGAVPTLGLVAVVATLFIFLTEMTSNTATSTMAMPIMAGVAAGTGNQPLLFMGVAALASSMAFMLPVATPPNAIVFGSGRVTIGQMIRAGIWLNLVSIVLLVAAAWVVLRLTGGSL